MREYERKEDDDPEYREYLRHAERKDNEAYQKQKREDYREYLHHAEKADLKEYHRRQMEKQNAQAARHAPQQMKKGGLFSSFRDRNSPENRQKRISELNLKAQEERAKTDVWKAKQARGGGFGAKALFGSGDSSFGFGGSPPKKSSRGYSNVPPAYSGYSQRDMSFSGLNDLFGGSGQSDYTPKRKKSVQRRSDGLNDMFGFGSY